MSRGRKSIPATEIVDAKVDHEAVASAVIARDTLALADDAVRSSSELFKLVGRLEAAHFYETVSSRLMAETYLRIKAVFPRDGGLPYPASHPALASDPTKRVSSLDEFCEVYLGRTQRRCQQLVANLRTLGPELYEQAEQIGFQARDYQALNALPMDAQEAVKTALASENPQAAVDLVYELATRLKAAKEEVQELAEQNEAKDRLLDDKNKKIDKLTAGKRFKPGPDDIARTAEEAAMLAELAERTLGAEAVLTALAIVVSKAEGSDAKAIRGRAAQAMQYMCQRLADIVDEHGIEVSLSEHLAQRPAWLNPLGANEVPAVVPGSGKRQH